MSQARIRFSADILRRLGEELNPSSDRGILELVKNSYDANATNCRIELFNVDQPGGSVVVMDDGDGMDASDVENGWLVLGHSLKSSERRTRLGRVPAGSKGLGRLASLRMGRRALLTTRPRTEVRSEYNLLIDWEAFDTAKLVDDVTLTIDRADRTRGQNNGTEVRIEDLRLPIGRLEVKRLARELILLADPFEDDESSFKPELLAPEFSDMERLVRGRYFEDAEFHLKSHVDNRGRAQASIVDWKGAELYSANHHDITINRADASYGCPAASFDLWVFILDKSTFSTRGSTLGEVREWLREFGGVHVYYNGLRVAPYGGPGDDWLEMNLRRVRSPEERPSTNTAIGRVAVKDPTDVLVQKTDRSGFIESHAFTEIRAFAQDVMEWMADRRLDEAEKRRRKTRVGTKSASSKAANELRAVIEKVPKARRERLITALDSYTNYRDREVRQLQREVQLYRTLSTAGITAATFAHESSGNPIKVISQSIDAIERRAKTSLGNSYDRVIGKPVAGIKRAIRSLGVLGIVTLKLLDYEKRRTSRVELHSSVRAVLDTFSPFLEARNVRVEVNLSDGKPYLRGSEAAIESIITNLLNNSLAAFEDGGTGDRLIRITTDIESDVLRMKFEDTGPGIKGISLRAIWLPGRTTRRNGTGLGLTIVKDAVADLRGRVSAVERSELGGAEFVIELPIIGK
jgi:signal transduction histidine kinase